MYSDKAEELFDLKVKILDCERLAQLTWSSITTLKRELKKLETRHQLYQGLADDHSYEYQKLLGELRD